MNDESQLQAFFVSDGFHSVRCVFSDLCRKLFEHTYPESVNIAQIVNMLICVQAFRVELRVPFSLVQKGETGTKNGNIYETSVHSCNLNLIKSLEVVLIVDELRVISFDRFGMKMPSSLAFDDQVCSHLNVLRHFLMKQLITPQ